MQMQHEKKRFLIASIIPQRLSDEEAFQDIKEVKELVDAYGGEVIDYVIQRREVHDKGNYLGTGKVREIAGLIKTKKINVVVLNALVKPGQLFDIKSELSKQNPQIEVWDRVDLILQIFSLHAATAEARLQIEIAAMRHMGPRIYGMGYVLSRQGGSIGTRGVGETNTELMKRHWREQMKKAQDKLRKLATERERQLERRRKVGLKTISLVGYTNAGKTSLYNLLTKKQKLAEDVLFATLDSNVGRLFLPESKNQVLVSDTIGFIRNLPTRLIDAFRSTLMESMNADALLHVVDASDTDMERKIQAVEDILHDLHADKKKQLFVFNKIDALSKDTKHRLQDHYAYLNPHYISVQTGEGIDTLIAAIESTLQQALENHEHRSDRPIPEVSLSR